jgi:hypothetical protein
MTGIQYITDAKGNRLSVVIDLAQHSALWEDFYDAWLAHQSDGDELISWEKAKRILNREKPTKRAAKRQYQPVKRSQPVKK